MDFWLPLMFEREEHLVPLARAAESAGMRGIALQDHVAIPTGYSTLHPSGRRLFEPTSNFVDPLITAATLLAATDLEVLSYVYVLTMREPITAAKQVATLSILSNGRFKFGAGVGWLTEELRQFHDPTTRGRRFDEMLAIMRGFWRDGVVEHHGEFFDIGPTAMYPIPQPEPALWIGGESDAAFRRAAEAGGWMGMAYGKDEMFHLLDRLHAALTRAGRGREAGYEIFIAPNFAPTRELFAEMTDHGVTSTLGMPWYPGDQTLSLDDKRRALDQFRASFID